MYYNAALYRDTPIAPNTRYIRINIIVIIYQWQQIIDETRLPKYGIRFSFYHWMILAMAANAHIILYYYTSIFVLYKGS